MLMTFIFMSCCFCNIEVVQTAFEQYKKAMEAKINCNNSSRSIGLDLARRAVVLKG